MEREAERERERSDSSAVCLLGFDVEKKVFFLLCNFEDETFEVSLLVS